MTLEVLRETRSTRSNPTSPAFLPLLHLLQLLPLQQSLRNHPPTRAAGRLEDHVRSPVVGNNVMCIMEVLRGVPHGRNHRRDFIRCSVRKTDKKTILACRFRDLQLITLAADYPREAGTALPLFTASKLSMSLTSSGY